MSSRILQDNTHPWRAPMSLFFHAAPDAAASETGRGGSGGRVVGGAEGLGRAKGSGRTMCLDCGDVCDLCGTQGVEAAPAAGGARIDGARV